MAKTNREGLTFSEWIAAARAKKTNAARNAWNAGEDPSDHAVKPSAPARSSSSNYEVTLRGGRKVKVRAVSSSDALVKAGDRYHVPPMSAAPARSSTRKKTTRKTTRKATSGGKGAKRSKPRARAAALTPRAGWKPPAGQFAVMPLNSDHYYPLAFRQLEHAKAFAHLKGGTLTIDRNVGGEMNPISTVAGGASQSAHGSPGSPRPLAKRKGGKRKGKGKDDALVHHGGLNNPGTVGEYVLHGVLIIGGTAAAVQMDKHITARPLGLRPSVYAFGGGVAVTIIAGRYKKPRLCRASAALTIGLGAGLVAQGLAGG